MKSESPETFGRCFWKNVHFKFPGSRTKERGMLALPVACPQDGHDDSNRTCRGPGWRTILGTNHGWSTKSNNNKNKNNNENNQIGIRKSKKYVGKPLCYVDPFRKHESRLHYVRTNRIETYWGFWNHLVEGNESWDWRRWKMDNLHKKYLGFTSPLVESHQEVWNVFLIRPSSFICSFFEFWWSMLKNKWKWKMRWGSWGQNQWFCSPSATLEAFEKHESLSFEVFAKVQGGGL